MNRTAAALLLALTAGCSTGEETTAEQEHLIIQPELAVGEEMGAEELVFGSIESMCFAPDGKIALLDRAHSEVRIFSAAGEYQRTIGGEGSGPGELSMTVYMGVSQDGHLYVSQRSGCSEFDYYSGEWLGSEAFNGPPPISITGGSDSTFTAIRMEMVETGTGLGMDVSVSRFTGPYTADLAYREHSFDLDPMDMSSFFQDGWYGYLFDVDRDGNVFIARASESLYEVTAYSPEGDELLAIERSVEPVRKTEEELEEEKRFYEARFQSLGMGQMPYTPAENWNTIRSLGVDGAGRIWAQRGNTPAQLFDVYSSTGDELFTAELVVPEGSGRFWQFTIEPEGILGWPEDPETGWQRFYLYPLPE